MASLTGVFSGLLAFAIVHIDDTSHRHGWSWIFILEGLFTFCFGIISYFLLPQSPSRARFLSTDEKAFIADVLERDGSTRLDEMANTSTWREVGLAFKLPHVWLMASAGFCGGMSFLVAR